MHDITKPLSKPILNALEPRNFPPVQISEVEAHSDKAELMGWDYFRANLGTMAAAPDSLIRSCTYATA